MLLANPRADPTTQYNYAIRLACRNGHSEVVRMLKTLLGPGGFHKGIDLYFARHDGHAATVDEFVRCFADANSTDLTQFMRWYSQAGTPEVVASGSYDAAAQTYRLEIAQTVPPTPGQPVKEPMVIPLVVALVGSDGRDHRNPDLRRLRR